MRRWFFYFLVPADVKRHRRQARPKDPRGRLWSGDSFARNAAVAHAFVAGTLWPLSTTALRARRAGIPAGHDAGAEQSAPHAAHRSARDPLSHRSRVQRSRARRYNPWVLEAAERTY